MRQAVRWTLRQRLSSNSAILKASQISLLYIALGGLWILFTDRLLVDLIDTPQKFVRFSTYAGGGYVAVTAILLYVLAYGNFRRCLRQQAHLRTLLDTIPDLVWLKDATGVFTFCNPAFARRFGILESEIVGRTDYDFFPEEMADFFREKDRLAIESGKPISYAGEAPLATGGCREFFEAIKTPVHDAGGALAGVLSIARNITERERAEEEQHRLQTTLAGAVELADLGPWEYDIATGIYTFNDYFYKVYHTSAEQVGGYAMTPEDYLTRFVHPDDAVVIRRNLRNTALNIDSEGSQQHEHRILYPDGSIGHVAVRLSFVKDNNGKLIKIYGVTQNITERKLREQEHLANLKYFECMEKINQAIQGGANDLEQITGEVLGICLSVFDCDRAFLLHPCDPDAPSWHVPRDRCRAEFPGICSAGGTLPMDPDIAEFFRRTLATPGPVSFIPAMDAPGRVEYWKPHGFLSQLTVPLRPAIGTPWIFGLHQCTHAREWRPEDRDLFEKISRRLSNSLTNLLMYRTLRENEEFLNSILENIPDMISVKDTETLTFLSVNRAGETLLDVSREDLIGKTYYDISPEEEAAQYTALDRRVIEGGTLVDVPEVILRTKAAEPKIVRTKIIPLRDETGNPKYLLSISENITEVKKLQARLSQTQKLESLGAMSGGIAHDFNNILQPILGYCELLKADLSTSTQAHHFVERILASGLRAKELITRILSFSRQSDRSMLPVELQPIIAEAVNLARASIPSSIRLCLDFQQTPLPVLADPTQLHQVVMNLMINAHHAVEEAGGEIYVRLNETALDEQDLMGTALPPGRYAMLSVTDTGHGMRRDILDRIFEP